MRVLAVLTLAAGALGACRPPPVTRPTTGGIIGLVRDGATGESIGKAELVLRADGQLERGATAVTTAEGFYEFEKLPPGRYTITAHYAGETVEITNIAITAGRGAPVDIAFELGRADPLTVDYGNPDDGAIRHYRPKAADPSTGMIEGTVTDAATRERVPGAVVTAIVMVADHAATDANVEQSVTDAHGRFVFPRLAPGTYVVSAYYTIERRGQIEVQRNGLAVQAGEALVVPLWVELESQ
jgi:large repetitive protein